MRSFPEIPAADVSALGYLPGAPIQVLVAEPDVVSRRLICSLVECEPEMTAECVHDSLMISAIQENAPELVILDANTNVIRRGGWDALGIEAPPATIVTAYDPSALAAFASIAVDTVVKPFNVERFETALELAKSRIFRARTELQVADGWVPEESGIFRRQFVQRLAVEEDEKIVLIRVDDIQWIQSLGKHIRLYAEEKSHLLRQSMKNLQAKLDPKRFLRVHRNAIVNLDHVDEFHLPPSGNMFVKLRNGVSLPLRRGTRNMLRKFLKQIS